MSFHFYEKFAKYYDLHTPDEHYISNVRYIKHLIDKYNIKSILDVGCGNGASLVNINNQFPNKIQLDGFDISNDMVTAANSRRVNEINIFQDDMLKFNNIENEYDMILSMSWVINYSKNCHEIERVLRNIYIHLSKNGLCLIEVPHIPNILEYVFCDKEKSIIDSYHSSSKEDIFLFFKFEKITNLKMKAIYNLVIQSKNIIMYEEHILNFCNAYFIKDIMKKIGFEKILIMDNPKEHNLNSSYNVLIKAFK